MTDTHVALVKAVGQLKAALATHVEGALDDIFIREPVGKCGEAAFLRLAAWSYVLIYEAGRIVIRYLVDLADKEDQPGRDVSETIELVHALRTWSFHNIGGYSRREKRLIEAVDKFFADICNSNFPIDDGAWLRCYSVLGERILYMLRYCIDGVSIMEDPVDGPSAVSGLKTRIERHWPATKFEALVSDAAIRLGIRVDFQRFTERRLHEWQKFIEVIPFDDDPKRTIVSLIERDLLTYHDSVLPINGEDVMKEFGIDPGPLVGRILGHAKELSATGVRGREALIRELQNYVNEVASCIE